MPIYPLKRRGYFKRVRRLSPFQIPPLGAFHGLVSLALFKMYTKNQKAASVYQ